MKSLSLLVILATLMAPTAKAENTLTVLKEYGIPCAVGLGLSALLVKNDGAGVGLAICAGVSAATYFNQKVVDDDKLRIVVDQAVDKKQDKIMSDIDMKTKQSSEEFKATIRQVVADKMVAMEDEIKAKVADQIKSGELMPTLEKRINDKIKEQVGVESKAREKALINQVVDEVIRQVEAKPIGLSK